MAFSGFISSRNWKGSVIPYMESSRDRIAIGPFLLELNARNFYCLPYNKVFHHILEITQKIMSLNFKSFPMYHSQFILIFTCTTYKICPRSV